MGGVAAGVIIVEGILRLVGGGAMAVSKGKVGDMVLMVLLLVVMALAEGSVTGGRRGQVG